MERIQGINPLRVQWCCDERGITPNELAVAVGIPEASIAKLMAGEDVLTFNQLRDLARFFDRGALFFLETGPVDETQIYTPQFRTIANQRPDLDTQVKALIKRVERQRAIYLGLREDLGEEDFSLFTPPAFPVNDVKRAAIVVREWLSIDAQNTFDAYRSAVEARGILVFRTNGYAGTWQLSKNNPVVGFSLFDEACPVIVIKKQEQETRQTFTLMHELCHVLLHRSSFIDQETDLYAGQGKEQEANAFAGYLLVPDALLGIVDDRARPSDVAHYDTWLRAVVRKSGASAEVVLRRLLDTGRLPAPLYGEYRRWARELPLSASESGSRAYRYREPRHIFGEPFVRTVFDALNARQITLARASTYLDNLKISDVHELEKHLAGL